MKAAAAAVMLGIAAAVLAVVPSALAVAGAPTAVGPVPERQHPAATGGVAIIASALRAQAVVTGVVSQVESTDVHGWRATLRVDRVLFGNVHLGDTLTIGWEELSVARQVRFGEDQRVLVVLDPLPTQSLWRKRFPARDRAAVMIVAADGEAFLPRPDGVTLDVLEHYLVMAPSARNGAPGAGRLAELVRGGDPAVAREALALLEAEPTEDDLLGADGAESLLGAARSPEREPALRAGALRLAARHRLPGTRETALALTEPTSSLRADAYRVLVTMPDGLSAERVRDLLTDTDPTLRAVGIENAAPDTSRERFVALIRNDPAPSVRLAAGRELVTRRADGAIGDVVGLLDDPDAAVRSGIAESIGGVGDAAVAPLRAVVDGGSERAALAAILGLARAGRGGATALSAIAASHPNQAVRGFARLALGEAPRPPH